MPNYLDAFIPSSPWGVSGGIGMSRPSLADWNHENPLTADGRGVYNGWRSPMETEFANAPMTDDQYALLLNGQVAKKSRKLRTAGDIARAQQEAAFLDSISAGDVAGIHDAPDSARQAQLQELLNREYVARARGANLSMAGMRRNEALERADRPYNLAVQKFNYEKEQDKLGRAFQREQFDATRGERQQRLSLQGQAITNQDENRDARLALDTATAGDKRTQLAWKRSFSETESALKNVRANKGQTNAFFRDAVSRVVRGEVPIAAADAMFTAMLPDLDASQREQVKGLMQKQDIVADVAEMTAQKYQRALSGALREARTQGYSPDVAMRRLSDAWRKDAEGRKYTIFNPEENTYIVNPNFARASRSRFSDAMAGPRDDGMDQGVRLQQPPTPSGFVDSAGTSLPTQTAGEVKFVPEAQRHRYVQGQEYPGGGGWWLYTNGQMVRVR